LLAAGRDETLVQVGNILLTPMRPVSRPSGWTTVQGRSSGDVGD